VASQKVLKPPDGRVLNAREHDQFAILLSPDDVRALIALTNYRGQAPSALLQQPTN
jgi:hypothetical protein